MSKERKVGDTRISYKWAWKHSLKNPKITSTALLQFGHCFSKDKLNSLFKGRTYMLLRTIVRDIKAQTDKDNGYASDYNADVAFLLGKLFVSHELQCKYEDEPLSFTWTSLIGYRWDTNCAFSQMVREILDEPTSEPHKI